MKDRNPSEPIVWLDDDGAPVAHADEVLAEPPPPDPRRRRRRVAAWTLAVAVVGAGIVSVVVTQDSSTPSAATSSNPSIPRFDTLPPSERTFALEPTSIAVPDADAPDTAPAAMLRAVRERLPGAKAGTPNLVFVAENGGFSTKYPFSTTGRRVEILVHRGAAGSTSVQNPSDYETVVENDIGNVRITVDLERTDGVPLTGSDLTTAHALASDARLTR